MSKTFVMSRNNFFKNLKTPSMNIFWKITFKNLFNFIKNNKLLKKKYDFLMSKGGPLFDISNITF
mgnify:CR=1 FL=1